MDGMAPTNAMVLYTISPEKLNEWISPKWTYGTSVFFGSRREIHFGQGPSFWVYIHSFHSGGTNHLSWRQEEGEDGGHLLLIVLVREHEQHLKMPKDPVKKPKTTQCFPAFFFSRVISHHDDA